MKRTKFLAVVLAVAMVFGMVSTTALAYGEITTDDPNGVNFDIPLTVGTAYEGEFEGSESYATAELDAGAWSGYAKGFTVTLEENTDYTIQLSVGGDDAAYVDCAVAVYYEGVIGYSEVAYADDYCTDLTLKFTSYLKGEYEILFLGNCVDENDVDLFDYTYITLLVIDNVSLIDCNTIIDVGDEVEITLSEDSIYAGDAICGGYAFGFNTTLTQGKHYSLCVTTEKGEDVINQEIDYCLSFAESVDGKLNNFRGIHNDSYRYVITPDRTGKFEFVFTGEAWNTTSSSRVFDKSVYYHISVIELTNVYFDIDTEDEYNEFADDLWARDYSGCAVIATIGANLDFVDAAYFGTVDTNADLLIIEGAGDVIIEGTTKPIVTMAGDVRIENITVKGNLYYDETNHDQGMLIGSAENAIVKNCNAVGFIEVANSDFEDLGGLMGYVSYATVSDSDVSVDITVTGGTLYWIGGVCGYSMKMLATNVNYDGNIEIIDPVMCYYVGGFVGDAEYYSVFENCSVTGEVSVDQTLSTELAGAAIGGFVGYLEDENTFINCNVNAVVYAINEECVGGFAGCIDYENKFYNCYATGYAVGAYAVGGFVGASNCCGGNDFVNCYACSSILGKDAIGGFIGETYVYDSFVNCYAYCDLECINSVTESTCIGTFAGYVPNENTFDTVFAQEHVNFSVVGPGYYEGFDPDLINVVDFDNDSNVDEVIKALNASVAKCNKSGDCDYTLMSWDKGGANGIPVLVDTPQYLIGDANGDGSITSADYTLVKRACFNTYTFEGVALLAADANGDGNITSADYSLIKRICFGTYVVE